MRLAPGITESDPRDGLGDIISQGQDQDESERTADAAGRVQDGDDDEGNTAVHNSVSRIFELIMGLRSEPM